MASFRTTGRGEQVVFCCGNTVSQPYFHIMNNGKSKLQTVFLKDSSHSLPEENRRDSKCQFTLQARTETILDNKETPKKINVTITDLSVCRSHENMIMQSREIFLEPSLLNYPYSPKVNCT